MEVHAVPGSAAKSRIRPKQRISHTKSRNGCYTCKQRRVKCDEERPMCSACWVRGENCVYPNPGGTHDQRRQPHLSRGIFASDGDQPQAPENKTNVSFRPLKFVLVSSKEPQNVDSQSTSSLNMSDLYLLQHYILHTSKKMTLHKSKRAAWEHIIPEMAATNEFLMHLVLALAGLDILTMRDTYARNDQGCSNHLIGANVPQLRSIMEHHQQGLAGLQEALCVTSEPDAEALLAGSMLVASFAFASFGIKDLDSSAAAFQDTLSSGPVSQGSLLNVGMLHIQSLQLVRGVTSILGQFWPTLRKCRLRTLLFFNHANEDWKLCEAQVRSSMVPSRSIHSRRLYNFATGANYAVSKLRDLHASLHLATGFDEGTESSPSIATPQSGQSGNVGEVSLYPYEKAIDVVEDLYMRILYLMHMKPLDCHASSDLELQADLEDAAISGWPHLLPEEFISSLDSQATFDIMQGVSLVILAHLYLTIALLDEIWFYGRRCDIEIYKINTLIGGLGDEKLISLMKWPIDVIQG